METICSRCGNHCGEDYVVLCPLCVKEHEEEIRTLRIKLEEYTKYKAFWDDARIADKMQWEKNRRR